MKKQCTIFLITLTALITNTVSLKAQTNPISGSKLSDTVCKSNFTTCANIAESANTLKIIYLGKNKTEKEAEDLAKNTLSQPGAGWDKGYKPEDVHLISKQWKSDISPFPLVDAQAILGEKIVNEGGLPKKQFMISIRGTEQWVPDLATDFASLRPRDYENGGKVGNGFYNYATTIAESDEFKTMVANIIRAENKNERYEVLISGHSLGGAAAVILKAMIEDSMVKQGVSNATSKVSAVTFGAPPVGDSEFANRYGNRVTGINISGDPVPSLGLPFAVQKVGSIYEFERPNDLVAIFNKLNDRSIQPGQKIFSSDVIGAIKDIAFSPINIASDIGSTVTGIDSHKNGYSEDRYNAARNNGWYDLRNDLMNATLSGMTQGGSSHIGSASYYLGRSRNQDRILNVDYADRVDRFDSTKILSAQQREQYTTPAGSIINLVAPVDVVLNWDQSLAKGQLDLDSHLTGPAGLGDDSSVRFHTYWDSRGSSTTAPYVLLYRDVIPANGDSGAEQTRIQVLQNGVYRFYVHDFTNRNNTTNSTALSQSGANVKVFNTGQNGQNFTTEFDPKTQLGSAINIPINQVGTVWRAFELDSRTGVLKPVVNVPFGNVSSPGSVPRAGENFVNTGGGLGK
jgi:hypothetical protein